jgi:hypothetical protein
MVEAIRAALLLAERQGDWKTATELLLILRSMR